MAPESDAARFTDAFESLNDAIFRHCYYRVFDRERAVELAQETFLRTWRYLAAGREIQNLKAFLYRTADHLIIDEGRRATATSLDAMHEASGFEARSTDNPALQADVALAVDLLERLDEPYRSAVIMRHIDGLSPQEIATITGESENVISVRIHRGLKQAHECLPNLL